MNQHLEHVSITQLVPNPFRALDDYPIDRDKLDKLKDSIRDTGFWGTIVARKRGNAYELAFGHHRRAALIELQKAGEIKKSEKVDIIVRELTNEQMIQLMARENLEEWGTNAYIEAQTVESTIRAFAAGEIELPEVDLKTNTQHVRHARLGSAEHAYTVASVAEFLGWVKSDGHKGTQPNQACTVAFQMIDAFDLGIVKRDQLRGVSREIAREIVSRAMALHKQQEAMAKQRKQQAEEAERRAAKEKDTRKAKALEGAAKELQRQAVAYQKDSVGVAKDFAQQAVEQVKKGHWSQRDVREAGTQAKSGLSPKREQQHKTARQLLDRLTDDVYEMLNPNEEPFASLRQLLKLDCGLEQHDIKALRDEVLALASRASKFAKDLGGWKPVTQDEQSIATGLHLIK
jgi:hypothetical protein